MKIFKNVLEYSLLEKLMGELNYNLKLDNWLVGSLSWEGSIRNKIQTNVFQCQIKNNAEELQQAIRKYLPDHLKTKNFSTMFHIYSYNSGISLHKDNLFSFGATLYLNDKWDIDDGGLFIWKSKSDNQYKVYLPEFNSMILNDEAEEHLVTPVNTHAQNLRASIQIFGKN